MKRLVSELVEVFYIIKAAFSAARNNFTVLEETEHEGEQS